MKRTTNIQTKDLVAEAIRNEILDGGMETGEELKQEILAEMLGVSRMPVREALQMLEQEGYIERLPNRHMVVAAFDEDKIKAIISLVLAMEENIILQGSEKPCNQLETILSKIEKYLTGNNTEWATQQELEFHYTLVRLLGITYIEQLFSKAFSGLMSYIICHQTEAIEERFQLLKRLSEQRRGGKKEEISIILQAYYQILLDSWDRKES